VDIPAILSSIKGKVLDAGHFDLLKHAYDLQNDNIEQLTRNNGLLKEEVARHKQEIKSLKAEAATLKSKVEALPKAGELDENERSILVTLSSCDYEPTAEEIASCLRLNLTRVEYHLERMNNEQYLGRHNSWEEPSSRFYLLQRGRAYLVENGLLQ
jgi:predicted RNase H-like nuclease (RuvC/YqgF family)